MSSFMNAVSIAVSPSTVNASAMFHLFFEIETALLTFQERLTQPWRRHAIQYLLELVKEVRDLLRLIDFHGMDVLRDDPRRTRAADCSDIEDRTILDGVELRPELVLIAIFLEVPRDKGLEKFVAVLGEVIDSDVFRPSEVGVYPLHILCCECDFHNASSLV